MKKSILFISIALIIIIIVGAFYFLKTPSQQEMNTNTQDNTPQDNSQTHETNTQENSQPQIVTTPSKTDVMISGYSFSTSPITINAGTSVVWTNKDSTPHTVTSDSGSELSSGSLSRDASYAHTFSTPGTYKYHCTFHPGMKGTIIVQ